METLDVETLEQIKNIVNIAKNEKVPLQKQKVKKSKKVKEVTLTPTISNAPNSEPEKFHHRQSQCQYQYKSHYKS